MSKLYSTKDKNGMYQSDDIKSLTFDVVDQLEKAQLILTREIRNLLTASAAGKLSPPHARDLCAYVKLLSELKAEQEAELASKKDEDLVQLKNGS